MRRPTFRLPGFPLTGFSLTGFSLLIAGVGVTDAALSRQWDLLVLFVVIGLVQLWTLVRTLDKRVTISLRPDLARWVTQRSQRTGEPATDVVDRAVALFQHGLYGDAQNDGP